MNDHVPCCKKSWRELAEIIRTSVITINEKSGGRQPQSRLDGSVTPAKTPGSLCLFSSCLSTAAKPGVHKVAVRALEPRSTPENTQRKEDNAGKEVGRNFLLTCHFRFRMRSLSQKAPDFLCLLLSSFIILWEDAGGLRRLVLASVLWAVTLEGDVPVASPH